MILTDNEKNENLIEFPKAHMDALCADAASFNKSNPGKPRWNFDAVPGSNFDAGESAFVARQLEHIRAGLYEVEYPDLKGARLVPTNTSVPSGKNQYTIQIMDKVGAAKVIADNATDIPDVEISTREATMKMFTIGLSYHYTLQESRAAMAEGMPLLAKKAMVCREQMERFLDNVIFLGDDTAGVKGLLNATDSGIVTYTTSTGGAGTTFETKSADEVLKDLHGAPAKVVSDSKEVDLPNTMLLPLTTKQNLSTRRVGDGTQGSILSYFLGVDPYISAVEALYQLESHATAWTGKRGMVYRRDPNCVELIVSQPFEQLPPQAVMFMVKTLTRMRTGGLAIYRPTSIARFDGI